MKSKYNTGNPIDIKEIPEEERKIAFHEWAEGSEALEELLNESYENDLLSSACCGGDTGHPYIEYELNDEKSRKIAMSIAEKLVSSDLDCEVTIYDNFWLNEFDPITYPTRDIITLNVLAKIENMEKVFREMTKYIKEVELDKVKLPKNEEEIPSKRFTKEKQIDTPNKLNPSNPNTSQTGKNLLDSIVKESEKMSIRISEINDANTEIKQKEKDYIENSQDIDSRTNRGE